MNQPRVPKSLPEDENMDPVGLPYPEQEDPSTPEDGNDPPHPPFSPSREPDIPEDAEFERVIQPEPPNV